MTPELFKNYFYGKFATAGPATEAGRSLLSHIERLDYGAYDAARSLLVDERHESPDGAEWKRAIVAIEQEAAALERRETGELLLSDELLTSNRLVSDRIRLLLEEEGA